MLKKYIKYIVVCLAVCCAFLLGIQWNEWKMEELRVTIKEQKAEMAGYKQEKDEMSFEAEGLLEEIYEKEMCSRQYEESIKDLWGGVEWLRDRLAEGNIDEEITADRIVVETNNAYYKMFYGKWRIASVIEGRYFEEYDGYDGYYNEEKAKKYLGKTVEYSSESVRVDGEQVLVTPAYAYAIVPANKYYWYVVGYDPQEDFVDYKKNDYFVYVRVGTKWNKCDYQEKDIFDTFFIIDDDTLVLNADGAYFWMERVEHIQDYEVKETIQDYYW